MLVTHYRGNNYIILYIMVILITYIFIVCVIFHDAIGLISYTHHRDVNETSASPISIVTALVDQIKIKTTSIASDRDLLIRGHVTWVGRSSIETTMHLHQVYGTCDGRYYVNIGVFQHNKLT